MSSTDLKPNLHDSLNRLTGTLMQPGHRLYTTESTTPSQTRLASQFLLLLPHVRDLVTSLN